MPILLAIVSSAVIALAYGPLLWEFARNLWSRPYYQHFPYVLLAAAVLTYEHLKTAPAAPKMRRPWLDATLLTASWLVLVLAVLAMSPLLAALSAILLTGGLLAAYSRQSGMRFPTGPWLLLWLVIPPPVGLDQRLLTRLQLISSDLASKALDLLGVGHLMEGNTLILPTKQLFVDEACSGIVSVISLSTCAAIYAVWQRRPLVHIALLMVAAVGWAVLLNVVRIVTIALAEAHTGVDLAEGVSHTLLGLGIFALNVLAVIALDWLLRAMLSEINPSEVGDIYAATADSPLHSGRRLIALWNWTVNTHPGGSTAALQRFPRFQPALSWTSLLAAAAFSIVGLGQLALTGNAEAAQATTDELPIERIVTALLEPGVTPDRIGELHLADVRHEQRESGHEFGEHSVIFTYESPSGKRCLVSCDLPFAGGWHELSVCYRGIGWEVINRELYPLASANRADNDKLPHLAELDLVRNGRYALVDFCACYLNGEPVVAPSYDIVEQVITPLFRRRSKLDSRPSLQVQVLLERPESPSSDDRQLARSVLSTSRGRILATLERLR